MADTWVGGSGQDDGWGPSTPVRSTAADEPAPRTRQGGRRRRAANEPAPASLHADAYAGSPWGPSGIGPSATSGAGASTAVDDPRRTQTPEAAAESAQTRLQAAVPSRATQRGLPGWAGLLVQVAVTALGIGVDALRGQQLGTGFNIGIIAGAVLSVLVVRRSSMFPVVVAPPIVYSVGAGASLYLRSNGLSDRSVLIDAATNWLVYGFPAIAAATAAVLIIAGIRLIVRR